MSSTEERIIDSKYYSALYNIESCCGSINNKKVLEIGSDYYGDFLHLITSVRNLEQAVGVNLTFDRTIDIYK